jgi:hypothetical protein
MKVESSRCGRDPDNIGFSLVDQVDFEEASGIVSGAARTSHGR